MNVEERLLAAAGKVEHFLGQILTTDDKDLLPLYASMRYSTLAGGKGSVLISRLLLPKCSAAA